MTTLMGKQLSKYDNWILHFLFLQFLQSINLSGTQAKPKITSVLRESDPKSRQLHFMDFNASAVTCTA